jgi:hypothetical protein
LPASPPLDPDLMARLPAAVRDTLRALDSTSSIDSANTLDRGPRATIQPGKKKGHRTLDDAIQLLKELGAESALTRRGTLGEGGMGVVHLAEQRALGREVAVKSVKLDARTADTTLKLLREAWITGALEHPNVVPVHDVRLDGDGQPQIVLKKIEGKPWSEVHADRAGILERFLASDPVEWNLRVFLQVAGAIHYAHSRGILHRDLKPDNVMLGELPRGVRRRLGPRAEPRRRPPPPARLGGPRGGQGRPAYIAPEMAAGDAAALSPRTDVYLLGAVLFQVLTGAPPHATGSLLQRLAHAYLGAALVYPPSLPADLVAVCERAMRHDPAERYASADELRRAVQECLRHRGSSPRRGGRPPGAGCSSTRSPPPALARGREHAAAVEALFTECRFGFQQALRTWPENRLAKEGLTSALRQRIDLELDGGNVAFASHLLGELPENDPLLLSRIEAARQREAEEREKQAAFHRDHDPTIGRRTRVFVGLIMCSVWILAPLLMWALRDVVPGLGGYPGAIAGTLALMGFGLGMALWARESLQKTWINRQLVMTVRITLIAQLALLVGSYLAGIAFDHAHTILVLTWGIGTALTANALETRLYPSAVGYLMGFLVLSRWPEWRFPVSSLTNLILLVNVMVVWARVKDDVVEPVRRRVREERLRRSALSDPPRP